MHEIFNMLLAVFDRAALMLICLFFLIRIRLFRELLHKSAHSPKELLAVTAIFSLFALFSTWSGVPVEGSLVNVRIIAVMSGGILFGPWVGIITGVIAGIHRYLIDIGGVTAIPCFITSILAGCISGWINLKIPKAQRWRVGILGGMLCETLTMILVIVWAPTTALGIDIVSKIGIPMILGSVCIGFIVLLVQSVEGEKEASAARQAKLALDIANKTLPLFRHVNSESLRKVCEIIRDDIHADAHEKMTFVYTRRESYVMPMNITEFCSKLPPSHFFRCHRSFCVNLNKIREIEPWFNNTYILRLKDLDFEVPVSRSKVKEFRQLMHL